MFYLLQTRLFFQNHSKTKCKSLAYNYASALLFCGGWISNHNETIRQIWRRWVVKMFFQYIEYYLEIVQTWENS